MKVFHDGPVTFNSKLMKKSTGKQMTIENAFPLEFYAPATYIWQWAFYVCIKLRRSRNSFENIYTFIKRYFQKVVVKYT